LKLETALCAVQIADEPHHFGGFVATHAAPPLDHVLTACTLPPRGDGLACLFACFFRRSKITAEIATAQLPLSIAEKTHFFNRNRPQQIATSATDFPGKQAWLRLAALTQFSVVKD
jgi:hypothetical protein